MLKRIKNIGPGALVAAAFIGPGTVTACTIAGAQFGYALLWALVFATLATIALQEMAARLGIVTQKGLGEVLRETLDNSALKWPLFIIIGLALFAGNCAYEGGNLSGAALGVEAVFGDNKAIFRLAIIVISALAAGLLLRGNYKLLEKILLSLVALMAISFLLTFFMVKPDIGAMFKGLMVPSIPEGSLFILIGLIGTTIVPYNIFLHASAVKDRWHSADDLKFARADTAISIGLGGFITILIAATAASFTPIQIILTAQFTNGLLLPIIATFLLFAMNQKQILGTHINGKFANIIGIAIVLITLGLGLRSALRAFGLM